MLNGTVGDVITTLDDKPIRTGADIFKLLDKHAAELNGMRKCEKASQPSTIRSSWLQAVCLLSQVPGDLVSLGVRRLELVEVSQLLYWSLSTYSNVESPSYAMKHS